MQTGLTRADERTGKTRNAAYVGRPHNNCL